jgi:hypothetical protein
MIEELKKRFSMSYRCIAELVDLSYATLMRWKKRTGDGKPALQRPGPRKVRPLDLDGLKRKIETLDHGKKRSRGAGRLHLAYADRISRRDLNKLIIQARRESNQQQAAERCRVAWLRPNLAWAMDDCSKTVIGGGKLHLHNLSDLCSRYKLPPIASDQSPCGEEVAGHLDRLFTRFGAPLFCKRDNGGNLNHYAVDQVLSDAMVIPINSPVYQASYNGAIERTQGEFKKYLHRWQWKARSLHQCAILAETAAHDINHRPRRGLDGKTACRAYFTDDRIQFPKRRRVSIYHWIRDLAERISIALGKVVISPTAWRLAAKQWLLQNGLIRIVRAGKVLPNKSPIWSHN